MTRIGKSNPADREAVRGAFGKIPTCILCQKKEATIWFRGNDDYWLCDQCAFDVVRILMNDLQGMFHEQHK